MCEPATLAVASFAFTALSTGLSYVSQVDSANQTAKYNQEVLNENAKSAASAYRYNVTQEATRMTQEEDAVSMAAHEINLERRRAAGAALASSNAAGMDIDELQMDFLRQEGNQRAALQRQMEWKRQQSGANMQGYAAQAKDRVAAYNPAPVQAPSIAGMLAGLGTSAVNTYSTYTYQNKKGK